jgi:hypothetical protein
MPDLWIVSNGKMIQSEDHLTWQIGENEVIFEEPFADINYTFHPDAPGDVVVHEVIGSRSVGGLLVSLDIGTMEGNYIAKGLTNEYRSTTMVTQGLGLIQHGSQALTAGRNTITFPEEFADTTYTFQPSANAVFWTIDMSSKTTTSIDIIMADDDPDFTYEAIGV